MVDNAMNVGVPPKRIKNKDAWTWRVVKHFVEKSKINGEIGFTIKRTHWVLRKGNFSS